MIEQIEIDGVSALVAPTIGPTRAGIAFRVGRADEILSRTGITHLVEHLALHHLLMTDYHFNGTTGQVVTEFHSQGSTDEVASFLTRVCDALSGLPVDRLEIEKEVLRTEASSRTRSVVEPMDLWRYGAQGYGLASFPEWGLSMLTSEDVRACAGRYFTKENAVAWIAGSVPPGLRLRLPPGRREPVPPVTSALPVTPAYFVGSERAVAFDAIVRRRTAAAVFASVLERELFRSLRQEGGLSYTANAAYEPRGDEFATIVGLADTLPEKQGAVLGGFIDILAKLRVGRIEQIDVDSVAERAEAALRHPEVEAGRLPTWAFNALTGQESTSTEQLIDEIRAVTVDDLHDVAAEAMSSSLLMVPEGYDGQWAGFTAAPVWSAGAVGGVHFPMRERRESDLVVGADGVSVVSASGNLTVRYDACVAMLSWPDGGRLLVGNDGISVRIEPTVYAVDAATLWQVDESLPPIRRVRLPARDIQSIPQAPEAVVLPTPPTPVKRSMMAVISVVLLGLVTLFFVCFGGLMTLGVAVGDDSGTGDWVIVGVIWLLALALILPTVVLTRRVRRRSV